MGEYFFCFQKLEYMQKLRNTDGCILCGIRDRDPDTASLVIAESDFWIACCNLYPYNPGHIMLFPKDHICEIRSLSESAWLDYQHGQNMILDGIDSLFHPHGYNIGFNLGKPAGASIDHIHAHIIPRYAGEIGIADLLAGKRVLVEPPDTTCLRLRTVLAASADSFGYQIASDPINIP